MVLLCSIVKNENRYLKEWVNYHKSIGFDKILLYDNNDEEYINIKDVDIIDYRNKHVIYDRFKIQNNTQEEAYIDCYNNYCYDWVMFLDIDEFLFIDNNLSINEFLSLDRFNNVDAIQINWEIYGDNDRIVYEDIPVLERFTSPSTKQTNYVKSIIRTGRDLYSLNPHNVIIKKGKVVYPNGDSSRFAPTQKINYEGAKIKHFYTKTIDEWIDRKIGTTDVCGFDLLNNRKRRIKEFFQYNKVTEEKINFIENKLL